MTFPSLADSWLFGLSLFSGIWSWWQFGFCGSTYTSESPPTFPALYSLRLPPYLIYSSKAGIFGLPLCPFSVICNSISTRKLFPHFSPNLTHFPDEILLPLQPQSLCPPTLKTRYNLSSSNLSYNCGYTSPWPLFYSAVYYNHSPIEFCVLPPSNHIHLQGKDCIIVSSCHVLNRTQQAKSLEQIFSKMKTVLRINILWFTLYLFKFIFFHFSNITDSLNLVFIFPFCSYYWQWTIFSIECAYEKSKKDKREREKYIHIHREWKRMMNQALSFISMFSISRRKSNRTPTFSDNLHNTLGYGSTKIKENLKARLYYYSLRPLAFGLSLDGISSLKT